MLFSAMGMRKEGQRRDAKVERGEDRHKGKGARRQRDRKQAERIREGEQSLEGMVTSMVEVPQRQHLGCGCISEILSITEKGLLFGRISSESRSTPHLGWVMNLPFGFFQTASS